MRTKSKSGIILFAAGFSNLGEVPSHNTYCIAAMLRGGINAHALVSTLGHYVNLRFVRGGWLMPLQLEMEDRWFWLCSSHDNRYHFVVHFEFCRTDCQMAFPVFLSFIRKDGSFATFWYVCDVEQSSRWRDTEHPKHRQNTGPTIGKRKSTIKSLVFRQ